MKIYLNTDNIKKGKLRRHSVEDILEMDRQIKRMLASDIIEPSESCFSANAHLVPKKNGQKRLVINYIPLNAATIKDNYPLPQIADPFLTLRNARLFCALDCTEGLWQIKVAPEDRDRTAFITPQGLFQFKRCPFGFTNSPAKYQRSMNDIFTEGLYSRCVIYIDDILVFGRDKTELEENLKWVLETCKKYDVKLKGSKCKYLLNEVDFLGFHVSYNSISPIKSKRHEIYKEHPNNKTEVQSMLGFFNYHSRFIEDYTNITKPLRLLIKDSTDEIVWTQECVSAVERLKRSLDEAEAQEIPDSYSPKQIYLKISRDCMESSCVSEEGKLISRVGACFKTSEINYTDAEKNLLAMEMAYKKFGPFLKGKVKIYTTSKLLKRSLEMKDLNERISRIILRLPPDIKFDIILLEGQRRIESEQSNEVAPDEIFYTDGACCRNGKPDCKSSWAVLAVNDPRLSTSGIVPLKKQSNNIAEVYAALQATKIASVKKLNSIMIVTDSKYVYGVLNGWI